MATITSLKRSKPHASSTLSKFMDKPKWDPQIVFVTPERAREILELNTINIKINESKIKRFVRDFNEGLWMQNPQTITIAEDGTLIDGQHRLTTVVRVNKGMWFLITKAPKEAFRVIDSESRKASAVLSRDGIKNVTVVAAIARLTINRLNDSRFHNKVSPAEISDFVLQNKHITQAAEAASQSGKAFPQNIIGSVIFLSTCSGEHRDKIGDFVMALRTGESMQSGDPRYELREKLLACRSVKGRANFDSKYVYNLVAYCWNAWVAGQHVTMKKAVIPEDEYLPIVGFDKIEAPPVVVKRGRGRPRLAA